VFRDGGAAAAARPVDSGAAGTVWHRVVVEGEFPPGTGAVVELRAADTLAELAEAAPAAHLFGIAEGPAEAARGAWLSDPTELPFHPGLRACAPVEGRSGSFSALIQQPDRAARELVGRHLAVTVRLLGSGQASPRIAGIRLWGGRFSLVRHYLPRVFHAPEGAASRAAVGAAHPKDFLDRHVAMFEGMLTRLEDKVAAAHLVTDPWAAPAEALDWLGGWIGAEMAPALDMAARRRMLANAVRLHRKRGTLPGLMLALDIVSDGEVAAGGIVAFEDHRLRRVFATILGADLGRAFDPLLGGPVESGNSFVGPTLVLGDAAELDGDTPRLSAAQETELAALFEAPDRRADPEAVRGFFAALAHRVTVLVHADADATRLALIRETARALTPAHVALRVEPASRPLILGLYALVGIDTYVRPRPAPSPVRVDVSKLGERDHVLRLPSLDPRFERGERP
jgi:phage tail-like protein